MIVDPEAGWTPVRLPLPERLAGVAIAGLCALFFVVAGCGPEEGGASDGAVDQFLGGAPPGLDGAGATAPGDTPPVGGQGEAPGPGGDVACSPVAHGLVWEAQDPISFHGQPVVASATHVLGDGCMTSLSLGFRVAGKCPLDLTFTGQGGSWSLSKATLRSDSECGGGYGSGKVYQANVQASTATLSNVPASVLAPTANSSCAHLATKMDLNGTLQLVSGGSTITMALTMLRVSGGLPSVGGVSVNKQAPVETPDPGPPTQPEPPPAEPEPEPEPEEPAPDPAPIVDCPAGGTGKGLGAQIANFTGKNADGSTFSLHDLCGKATGIFLLQTAEW